MSLRRNKDGYGIPSSSNGGGFAHHRREMSRKGLSDERQVIGAGTPLETDNFLTAHESSARWAFNRDEQGDLLPFDSEDAAQDALLSILEIGKRDTSREIVNARYVTKTVQNIVVDRVSRHNKSERAAAVIMEMRVLNDEQRLGRGLTRIETETIGEKIIESWPDQSRRPMNKFWSRQRAVAQSVNDTKQADMPASTLLHRNELQSDKHYGRLLLEMENSGARTSEMNILRYVALAEQIDAPMPIKRRLTKRQVKLSRDVVSAHGGVVACAQAHLDGTLPDEANRALFSPFAGASRYDPPLDDADAHQVATALLFHRKASEKLWDSAIIFASMSAGTRVESYLRREDSPHT